MWRLPPAELRCKTAPTSTFRATRAGRSSLRATCSVDNLSQLPPQVDSVPHADVQTLPVDWSVHVCGVTREQHAPAPIRHRLTRHVGKAGDPVRAVHAVVLAVNPDERVADVLQGGLIGA